MTTAAVASKTKKASEAKKASKAKAPRTASAAEKDPNTPRVIDPHIPTKVVTISIDDIAPGPWNARHGDVDVESLAASIRAQGLIDPIQVRRRDKPGVRGPLYDIIAGERRWRACKLLGFDYVDVIARDVTPAQAAAICYTENAEREDLPLLAEAEAVAQVVKEAGELAIAAELLGQSIGWVSARANIGTNLVKSWKHRLETGELPTWGLAHLGQIARLDERDQTELLKTWQVTQARSAKDLAKVIDQVVTRKLSNAGWKRDFTGGIKGAPACCDCPKRTSQQRALFEDVQTTDDRCLDGACWTARAKASTLVKIGEAVEQDNKTVVLADKWGTDSWLHKEGKSLGAAVVEKYDYVPAKKTEKGAIPALKVEDGRATKTWVKKALSGSSGSGGGTSKPEVSREDRLRGRRWAALAGEVQAAIAAYDPAARLTLEQIIALVTTFGTWGRADSLWGMSGFGFPFDEPKLKVGKRAGTSLSADDVNDEDLDDDEDLEDEEEDDLQFNFERSKSLWRHASKNVEVLREIVIQKQALWNSVRSVLFDRARWTGAGAGGAGAKKADELANVSAFLGLDSAAMRARVEEAIPIPKTWPEKARQEFTW